MEHLYKETPEDRMKKIEALKEQIRKYLEGKEAKAKNETN